MKQTQELAASKDAKVSGKSFEQKTPISSAENAQRLARAQMQEISRRLSMEEHNRFPKGRFQ